METTRAEQGDVIEILCNKKKYRPCTRAVLLGFFGDRKGTPLIVIRNP